MGNFFKNYFFFYLSRWSLKFIFFRYQRTECRDLLHRKLTQLAWKPLWRWTLKLNSFSLHGLFPLTHTEFSLRSVRRCKQHLCMESKTVILINLVVVMTLTSLHVKIQLIPSLRAIKISRFRNRKKMLLFYPQLHYRYYYYRSRMLRNQNCCRYL